MYPTKLENEMNDQLFRAILTLKDMEECYRFFEDICTIGELKSLAQRLEVARLLRESVTYHDISEQTGASTATISRVNRCLAYGSEGYQRVLERMDVKESSREEERK